MLVQLDYIPYDPGTYLGPTGNVNVFTPSGTKQSLDRPAGMVTLLERPSFAQELRNGRAQLLIAGGLNDNGLLTDQRMILRHYIAPMSEQLVESAAPTTGQIGLEQIAGPGLTGLCIFYLRWEDTENNRLSPFSAASPTLNLTGATSIRFRNVPARPTPDDYPVNTVSVWVRRNGAAIRKIAVRDTGAATFDVDETVEGATEEVDNLQRAPRCRYNATYHDRYWQAGDSQNPQRLYYSPPGRLSEFAGGYLATRQGEAIVGLIAVRDVLVVLCARSSYYVQGYSEEDFSMQTLEPSIGALTHHGCKMIGDMALIPSHRGPMLCSGTSMTPVGSGAFASLWTEMYSADPLAFELGFGVNDERSKVYKFFMESVTVTAGVPTYSAGRFWVLDYKEENGGVANPLLSFDVHAARPKAAAMLATPGGKAGDLYCAYTAIPTGAANRIVKENVWTALDQVGARTHIIQPSIVSYDPDGGPNDGIEAEDGWALVTYKTMTSWLLEMMHGPERAFIRNQYSWALTSMFAIPEAALPASGGGREITPAWGNWTVANTTLFQPGALPFKMGLTGEGVGIRLSVVDAIGLVWRGWGMTVTAGKKFLAKNAT